MVHALQEIWRVLRPGKRLIDLRPLAGHSRVEVMAGSHLKFAGMVDESVDTQDDLAADNALAQVVDAGWFSQVRKTVFDYAQYWDTLDEMKAYAEARWTNSFVPGAVLARTQQLITTGPPPARLRIRRKMLIAGYKKRSS